MPDRTLSFDQIQEQLAKSSQIFTKYLLINLERFAQEAALNDNPKLANIHRLLGTNGRLFSDMAQKVDDKDKTLVVDDQPLVDNQLQKVDDKDKTLVVDDQPLVDNQLQKVNDKDKTLVVDTKPLEDLEQWLKTNTELLKKFGEIFESFDLKFSKTGLDDYKTRFLDYFFTPIEKSKEWESFLNEASKHFEEGQSKNFRDKVAGALAYKIQSVWIANQKKIAPNDQKLIFLTKLNNVFNEGFDLVLDTIHRSIQKEIAKDLGFLNTSPETDILEAVTFLYPIIKGEFKKTKDIEKHLNQVIVRIRQFIGIDIGIDIDQFLIPALLNLFDQIDRAIIKGRFELNGKRDIGVQDKTKTKMAVARVMFIDLEMRYPDNKPELIKAALLKVSLILGEKELQKANKSLAQIKKQKLKEENERKEKELKAIQKEKKEANQGKFDLFMQMALNNDDQKFKNKPTRPKKDNDEKIPPKNKQYYSLRTVSVFRRSWNSGATETTESNSKKNELK